MNFINNTSQPKPEIPTLLPNTVPLPETDPSQKPPYVPIPDDIEPIDPKSPNPQPTPPEMPPSNEPPDTIPLSPHSTNPLDPINSA